MNFLSKFFSKKLENIDYIQTFTNKEFWFPYPTIDMFCVEDEAHALSNLCRFGGHSSFFYSVGIHCLHASYYVNSNDPLVQFEALHHEIEEAYMIDLPTPIKYLPDLVLYRTIGKYVKSVGRKYYCLPEVENPLVKEIDLKLLVTEKNQLMPKGGRKWKCTAQPIEDLIIRPMNPREVEDQFLARHWQLCRELGMKC